MEWETFAEEVLKDLQDTGSDFWDEVKEDQVPILKQTAKDLAKYTMLLVKEPEKREQHLMTMKHLQNIVESEAALSALRARNHIKAAINNVLRRVVSMGFSLI